MYITIRYMDGSEGRVGPITSTNIAEALLAIILRRETVRGAEIGKANQTS
jgi:hypothetical protein